MNLQPKSSPASHAADLEIEYVPLDELKPDPNNPRIHPPGQIKALAKAIQAEGFTAPILTDLKCRIIAGHGRLAAARSIGMKTVPIVRLNVTTTTQRKRIRISDNKLQQQSAWDNDLLAADLRFIMDTPDLAFDPEPLGFSTGEIDVLLKPKGKSADPADEHIPAVLPKPVSRTGDIWVLNDRHRVGCGDCRDRKFLRRVVEGKVAAAFLDVPYNVKIDGHAVGKGKVRHREFAMV